jgi:t-SNARE complex subunit (syntaxin)
VKGAFIEDVEQETQVVNTFYAALQQGSRDPAAIQAVKEWKDTHETKLKQDRKAAQAYSKMIGTMMEAHQKLYDSRDDLANKDVLSAIQGYVKQLKKLEKTLRSLT